MSHQGVPDHEEIEASQIRGFEELNKTLVKESDKIGVLFGIFNNCSNTWHLKYTEEGLKKGNEHSECFRECISKGYADAFRTYSELE